METNTAKSIAIVTSGHIPSYWAHSINTAKHAKGFGDIGLKPTIFSVLHRSEYSMFRALSSMHQFYGIPESIPIHLVRDHSLYYYRDMFPLSWALTALDKVSGLKARYFHDPEVELAQQVIKLKPDLVYARTYRAVYTLVKNGIPTIMETHRAALDHPHLLRTLSLSQKAAFLGITTIHESIRDRYMDAGIPASKILVAEDAVDEEDIAPETFNLTALRNELSLPSKRLVMYVGSLHHGKGIPTILDMAERMRSRRDVTYVVVGGPTRTANSYRRMCSSRNLSNVKIIGPVPPKQAVKYRQAADVLLLCPEDLKRSVMDYDTTSPLKLFEYMASGTPIVATSSPATSRILEHNKDSLIANSNMVEELVALTNSTLDNTAAAKQRATCAKQKIYQFTYQQRCQKILNFFVL